MRCLVTGATGFVGRRLVSALTADGAFVRGASRSGGGEAAESVAVDLAELAPTSPICHGIDVIYHLAARTHDMREAAGTEAEYWRINVEGTRRLIDAACRAGVRRFVFVSSVKAIDEGNRRPADETTPENPQTPYGWSKLEAEQIVRAAGSNGRIESVCLRFPLVYGPGQRGNMQRLIAAVRAGRFPPLPGGNLRSMLHIDNAVAALRLAGSHPAAVGRTYIVTDGRPYETREIVDAIRVALGRRPFRWHIPYAVFQLAAWGGDVARLVLRRRIGFDSAALQKLLGAATYDSSAIARELGYRPARDLIESLTELLAEGGDDGP